MPTKTLHEPLVERALVGFDLAAEHHIAHCPPCQTEREKVEDALRQFGAANREYANRSESFWEQQAARIRAAQQESKQRSRLTMALVPSVVVLLLLAVAIAGRGSGSATGRGDSAGCSKRIPITNCCWRWSGRFNADTPRALEPATLMVEDSDGNRPLNSYVGQGRRSRSHEN